MSEGTRIGFVENDTIGNFAIGSRLLGNFSSRNNRKKVKKPGRKRRNTRRKYGVHRVKRSHSFHKKTKGGIKYTKKGQPYRIMPNGRARFIKK